LSAATLLSTPLSLFSSAAIFSPLLFADDTASHDFLQSAADITAADSFARLPPPR
jgi:hypothetical protein